MNNILPVIVVVLVAFSVLRAVVPRQIQLRQDPTGFHLQRPLGARLLESVRSLTASAVMIALFVASYGTDFEIGLIVSAVALVILLWGVVNRLWRSAVVISRIQNQVLLGPRLIGRTSDIRSVELRLNRRAPLSLTFRAADGPDWRWVIPGADPRSAPTVGEQIATYLGVPLERDW
jgi:hypothetical protein